MCVCVRNMVCIDFSSTIESFSAWNLRFCRKGHGCFLCVLSYVTWHDVTAIWTVNKRTRRSHMFVVNEGNRYTDKGMQRCKCWQKDARLDHWFFSIVPLTECLLTEPPQSLEQFGLHASGCWWMGKSDVVLLISVCRLQKWKSSILS